MTPSRLSSPSAVPPRRIEPGPRKVRLPTEIGSTASQPSRERVVQKPMSSVPWLSSPNETSGLSPVETEISVPRPTSMPISRNHGRVYIDA